MKSLDQYSILIVDDDPSWRETVSQILESYDVVTAGSASGALECLLHRRNRPFDVAILDKRLVDYDQKDQSGLNLARELKNLCPNCQIIILTGYSDVSSTREAFLDIQVADVLEKYSDGGLKPDDLRSTVARVLFNVNACFLGEKKLLMEMPSRFSKPLIVIHLSDLHFGTNHRFNHDGRLPEKDAPNLHKALSKCLRMKNIVPDIVIISGDLTQSADFGEFQKARYFIDSLKNEWGLSANQMIVVPGNHDVRWNIATDSDSFAEYQGFYSIIYQDEITKTSPFSKVEFFDFDDKPPLAIVGLDSCVIESSETAGIGYVGTSQLDNVFEDLNGKIGNIDCVKIAVLHHHLVPVIYLEKVPDSDKNFSLVADAVRIINRLQQNNFSLILHGHQHQSFCTQIKYGVERSLDTNGLTIIGMGSAGIKSEFAGSAKTNYFGVIEIAGLEKLYAHVQWFRSDVNEPEDNFELDREFSILLE